MNRFGWTALATGCNAPGAHFIPPKGSAYTSTLDLLEVLKQNGIPVVILTGDNHGAHWFPCYGNITCHFCWSVGHLTYAERLLLVRTPHFGTSLKWRNRFSVGHVSCVAMLARTSGRANVGHPTETLGRACIISESSE